MTDGKKSVAYYKFITAFRRLITVTKRKPKGRSYFGDSEFKQEGSST